MPVERLGSFARARVAVGSKVLSLITGSPWLTRRLGAARAEAVEGRRLDPQIAALMGLSDRSRQPEVHELSPEQARELLLEQAALCDAPPPGGVRAEDRTIPGPAGPLRVRLYTPEGVESPSPGVLYIHGGGWVTCNLDTHDGFCRRLALGARCRVVSLEYRLAPEHRFPAAVEDSLAAFRWVASHAQELLLDPRRLAVAGDSAGGNLSAVVGLRTRGEEHRPALQVLIYPAVDATCSLPSHRTFARGYFLSEDSIRWYYGNYLGGPEHKRHPDASPLHAPEVAGAPAALVYTAGFDTLRDEGKAYADRLREAGVPVAYREFSGLPHGFTIMTRVSAAARQAVEDMAAEVGRELR